MLDVQVEGRAVEDLCCGMLVLVGPAPNLDHALHVRHDEFRVLLGHDLGAGDGRGDVGHLQGPVRIPGQVFDRFELARRFLQLLEDFALRVDRIDNALFQRGLQRTLGQVVLVVTHGLQFGWVFDGVQELGIVVPIVRVGELDDLDVFPGHAVHPQHQLDALFLLDAPPIVFDGVHALGEADLLAFQVGHPVDVVPGAHQHAAAFVWRMRHPQEPGPAEVGVNGDGRKQAAEADQVVQVVDVMRIPVVLTDGTEVGKLHAELLELLPGPTQILIDVSGGYKHAVGVPDLVPVQWSGAQFCVFERRLLDLRCRC